MKRVIAYVDGFNLYYGLKTKGWKRYYWLDVQLLIRNLLATDQNLVFTKYFTSRVSSTPRDPEKSKRQNTYLEALQTLEQFRIYYGHYLGKSYQCFKCGASWQSHEEKMTDVNIAVELMVDAFQDKFDVAMLVSGDGDLWGPIDSVRRLFPAKQILVRFPPERESTALMGVASQAYTIGRKKLADSQFPDAVKKPDGYTLRRPEKWK